MTIANVSKCLEYTNSSIAWRIEFYNSYIAKFSQKKAVSEKLGFRYDNLN